MLLRRLGVQPAGPLGAAVERAAARGQAAITMLEQTTPLAVFAVADAVREESREAVRRLQEQGIEVVMMTGDARAVAAAVAAELGIETVFAEVLPGDKAAHVKVVQARGSASPWWATGSTTRRRSSPRTSGSPSAPGPTWRSRPATWCSSEATRATSRASSR
jgi:high-affinity K+ transport system ATPase subunit B